MKNLHGGEQAFGNEWNLYGLLIMLYLKKFTNSPCLLFKVITPSFRTLDPSVAVSFSLCLIRSCGRDRTLNCSSEQIIIE